MEKFLKSNDFVKIPKRGKNVKAVYCCPEREIFVTVFKNGEWSVSKAGHDGLDKLEFWRTKIEEYMENKTLKGMNNNRLNGRTDNLERV